LMFLNVYLFTLTRGGRERGRQPTQNGRHKRGRGRGGENKKEANKQVGV